MVNLKDCVFDAVRGSGPGGQAVSKTSNMAVIIHTPSKIVVKVAGVIRAMLLLFTCQCHETRSLEQNKKIALRNLERQLDNRLNGPCSMDNLEALKARAKRQTKANKARKKYQNISTNHGGDK